MKEGFVNKSASMLGQADPKELWREIASRISDETLLKPDLKILIPGCGYATEALAIANRMYKLGVPQSEIMSKFYLLDKYSEPTAALRHWGWPNVIRADFLTWQTPMKFDVTIGNPPYQNSDGVNKIWPLFVKKALSLLNDDGVLAFITPSIWVYRDGRKTSAVRTEIENWSIKYIDLTASRYFPTVGEDICSYVVCKGNTETEVVSAFGKTTIQDATIEKIAGTNTNPIISSIMKKVETSNADRLSLHRDMRHSAKDNPAFSTEKINGHQHLVHYTASQSYYLEKIWGEPSQLKVMINVSGNYYHKTEADKYIFKTTAMSGKGMYHIPVNNDTEADNLIHILRSKAFRFYIENEKTSGFTTGLPKLPMLDVTKTYTDSDIYNHFGFTQDEINFIEENV